MRKPRHRNSTRDSEKAELSTLRGLSRELETHLAVLRRGGNTREGATSAWRCFSDRQARARQAAERTNSQLSDRVQSNADWIQRLWELLHEKRRAAESTSVGRMGELQQKAGDNLVLGELKQQAAVALSQLPSVFSAHGIHFFDGSLQTTSSEGNTGKDVWSRVQTGDHRSTLVCVRRVPFDVHSTSAAIWTTISCPDKSFAGGNNKGHDTTPVAHVVERTPSVCTMKFRGRIQENHRETTPLHYHAVVRRESMPELPGASVFVWHSFFKLADGPVKHQDTMWVVVAKRPSGGLESIVTLVCKSQTETGPRANGKDNFQTAVMQETDACVETILSSADDILFEQSLNGAYRSNRSNDNFLDTASV